MGGDRGKKQQEEDDLTNNSTTSASPPPQLHQTTPPTLPEIITTTTTTSFLSPPLYTTTNTDILSNTFDQNHLHYHLDHLATTIIKNNQKRPKYTSSTASQWKLLPSPSSSTKKQTLPPHHQHALLNDNPPLPTTAAAASSSDTAASSNPSHPSLSASTGQDYTVSQEPPGGENDQTLLPQQHKLQLRKGKVVGPPWKPNEMLWLARAWRIQYQQQTAASNTVSPVQGRSGTKTRAEKDKQVSEYLKMHGVKRDAKMAGTKWDNMLGDYRKVYRWERCGGRDQTGKSYFNLSPVERKMYDDLPSSFDQQVFEELSQFVGSKMRTLHHTNTSDSHLLITSLPPPPIVVTDNHQLPLTTSAGGKQLEMTSARGHDMSCSELKRIGKVKMIWEESVSLWGEEGEYDRGRVKLQGLSFLNADELTFLDDLMVACTMETYEDDTFLQGFSVDKFVCGQQIKVFGRRKSCSSVTHPPQPHPSTSFSAWEFQDPTEYYVACLKIPPPTLPSLIELSWHLQEPPPDELRFPLRKDVYRDLPHGKEFFFTTSIELLDCRAITYDILSPILQSNPSLTAATASTKESFISLYDNCINRVISKFCSLDMVFVRKPSSLSNDDEIQHQWPNVTAFVQNLCLWRGEETSQLMEGQADTSNLFVNKLSWTFMDLPYVLGYYSVGYNVTFCAFSHSQDSDIIRTDLCSLDLSTPAERLKALNICWRVAGLLPLLAERCFDCINNVGNNLSLLPYSDFERMVSSNGNVVEMTPSTVTRYLSTKTKLYAVKELHDYIDQRIPHSETVFQISDQDLSLTFKPRGCKFKPVNCDQLIEALKCITEALVALHDLSFMHRDLHWDNVAMRISNREENKIEWFLTGFEEAVGAPQINPHAAADKRHAPEMGRGMHGVKVDVWAVGQLVKSSGVVSIPKLLREMQNRCLEPNPEQRPTAADCYHHLLQLQSPMPNTAAESTMFD